MLLIKRYSSQSTGHRILPTPPPQPTTSDWPGHSRQQQAGATDQVRTCLSLHLWPSSPPPFASPKSSFFNIHLSHITHSENVVALNLSPSSELFKVLLATWNWRSNQTYRSRPFQRSTVRILQLLLCDLTAPSPPSLRHSAYFIHLLSSTSSTLSLPAIAFIAPLLAVIAVCSFDPVTQPRRSINRFRVSGSPPRSIVIQTPITL